MSLGRKLYHLDDPIARAHPLNRGLLAWWIVLPGLAGGRTWYDVIGRKHGTLSGTAWRGTTRPGGAGHLLFDGTDDTVAVSVEVPARHTISAWARLDATTSYPMVTSANADCELRYFAGTSRPEYVMLGAEATSPTALPLGGWHHLSGVSAAANLLLYVDGAPAGSAAASSRTGTVASLGSRPAPSLFLPGALDDVAIYGRDLSAGEIKARFDLSRSGYAID